jgi:hypothetical protein
MAHARVLIAGAALALAVGALAAAGPCEEDRGRTGLALAPAEAGLVVAAVDAGSPAEASGLAAGDTVGQVNDVVPRSCADYQRTVRAARKERKALLVLVRRGAADVAVALAAATWERAVAAVPPPPPAEPPSVKEVVAKPPPPPLPPEARVTLEGVMQGLEALGRDERPTATLAAYRKDLLRLHREVETLAVRRSVPPDVVAGLRTVLRYYDAAEIAWDAEEQLRERERRPRHLPSPERAAAPYFSDSEVAAALDEFPFLRPTVAREPSPGLVAGESSGLWRPLQARALLWQHGHEELSRLGAWVAGATP